MPKEINIDIVCRDYVRVFFQTKADAVVARYPHAPMSSQTDGYVHAFSGLRGDAKQLYQEMMCGAEQRVQIVSPENEQEQSDLVVWARGYQSQAVQIYDWHGNKVQLAVENGQVQADYRCRAVTCDRQQVLSKVYCFGIGYPATTHEKQRSSTKVVKADSFSLYMNVIGDIVLRGILPKTKASKIGHFDQFKESVTFDYPAPITETAKSNLQKSRSKSEHRTNNLRAV